MRGSIGAQKPVLLWRWLGSGTVGGSSWMEGYYARDSVCELVAYKQLFYALMQQVGYRLNL